MLLSSNLSRLLLLAALASHHLSYVTAAPPGSVFLPRQDTTDSYHAATVMERRQQMAEPDPGDDDGESHRVPESTKASASSLAQVTPIDSGSSPASSTYPLDRQDAFPSAITSLSSHHLSPDMPALYTDLGPSLLSPTTTSSSDSPESTTNTDTASQKAAGGIILSKSVVAVLTVLSGIFICLTMFLCLRWALFEKNHRRAQRDYRGRDSVPNPIFMDVETPSSPESSSSSSDSMDEKDVGSGRRSSSGMMSIRDLLPTWADANLLRGKHAAHGASLLEQPSIVVTPPQDEVHHFPLSPSMILARTVNRTRFLHPNSAHQIINGNRHLQVQWIDMEEDDLPNI